MNTFSLDYTEGFLYTEHMLCIQHAIQMTLLGVKMWVLQLNLGKQPDP